MAAFFFIIANLILLGLNISAVVLHSPALNFSTAVLIVAAGITGRLTSNTNIFLFWLSLGLGALYTGLGILAFAL